MRLRPGLLGMLGALGALLAAVGILLAAPHALSPAGAQALLGAQVQSRLEEEGLGFAQARMRGQTAILTGHAPSAAARARAEQVALTAAGAGGPWLGGVARVVNEVEVGHGDSGPQAWLAVRADGRLRLQGAAPTAQIKADLLRRAEALSSGSAPVLDASTLSGQPVRAGWERLATEALHHLARLQSGEVRFVGERVFLLGVGGMDAVARARQWADAEPPPGFTVTADVAPAQSPEDVWGDTPGACRVALARVLRGVALRFEGKGLAGGSDPAVEQLAAVARRCDRAVLEVRVRGADPAQAEARGRAVVQALLLAGVQAQSLRALPADPAQREELAILPQPGTMAASEGER